MKRIILILALLPAMAVPADKVIDQATNCQRIMNAASALCTVDRVTNTGALRFTCLGKDGNIYTMLHSGKV